MDEYLIKSSESRNFSLLKKDQELGHLLYPNWFSFKAEIIMTDSSIYEIGPVGFWGTTIEVKHDDVVLANFKMNWNGHIILKTFFEDREVDFMFKNKGFFKRSYILENQQHEEMVSIQQEFKWDKFNFEFVLNATPIFKNETHNHILYLICIHCANYFTSLGTGNASSMS
ncbi:MAG TPA: hypothetical protein PLU10_10095 [Chitinophagaceae bacterium]|nr:hypothetical protein [Chitinophagaceae bacterium]